MNNFVDFSDCNTTQIIQPIHTSNETQIDISKVQTKQSIYTSNKSQIDISKVQTTIQYKKKDNETQEEYNKRISHECWISGGHYSGCSLPLSTEKSVVFGNKIYYEYD